MKKRLPVTGAGGPEFHGWDELTLGMIPATKLFPSERIASYVDRVLKAYTAPSPFQLGAPPAVMVSAKTNPRVSSKGRTGLDAGGHKWRFTPSTVRQT